MEVLKSMKVTKAERNESYIVSNSVFKIEKKSFISHPLICESLDRRHSPICLTELKIFLQQAKSVIV